MEKFDRYGKAVMLGYVLFLLLILLPSFTFAGGPIQNVRVEPMDMDVSGGEKTRISWSQAGNCVMNVMICSLDGWIVRNLHKDARGKSGRQTIAWDGRDDRGRMCPDGVYLPIIRIWSEKAGAGTYNPTASKWGLNATTSDITYDPDRKKITYNLKERVLCLMHIGEVLGPIYRTLFGYEVRNPGLNEEDWDGLDVTGNFNIGKKEKLWINLDAYTLPENSISVTGSKNKNLRSLIKNKKYPLHPPHGGVVFNHALHKRHSCGDFTIGLEIAGKDARGRIPVLKGIVPIRIHFKKGPDLARFKRETFESYFFMDGQFVSEVPQEKLPAVFKIDTTKFKNGEHVLSVNLRTLEDHMGTYSKKIRIKN